MTVMRGPWHRRRMTTHAWIAAYRHERFARRLVWGGVVFIGGILLGVFMSGCATVATPLPVEARAGEEQAVHIIWVEAYGRTDRPPLVRWIQGEALSCTDHHSGKPGFPVALVYADEEGNHAGCREGWTWSPREVLVAWRGELSFADTAISEELLHAAKLRDGDFRDQHKRPEFFQAIDMANQRVREAGR